MWKSMPRPAPNILLEVQETNKIEQIIESDGVWSVYYKNKPINLRTTSIVAFVSPRYKPVSFPNKGHAINLAKKLNKKFNTSDFTVVTLVHAATIYP